MNKNSMILAISLIPFMCTVSTAQTNKQKNFIKEVNNIRHLKGLDPLSYSNDLQKLTNKHSEVIKEHCQIIREKGMYISALGTVSVMARKCKGKVCQLTPIQIYAQTLKGEAWSLAYRKNNIYSLQTDKIGVSFVKCKVKSFLIILTGKQND